MGSGRISQLGPRSTGGPASERSREIGAAPAGPRTALQGQASTVRMEPAQAHDVVKTLKLGASGLDNRLRIRKSGPK